MYDLLATLFVAKIDYVLVGGLASGFAWLSTRHHAEEFGSEITAELDRWGKLIREANIRIE